MMKYFILLLTFIFTTMIWGADSPSGIEVKDDGVVLKPAELIDLILEERMRTESAPVVESQSVISDLNPIGDLDEQIVESKPEESGDDMETMKNRKVWSRWSKWGSCSVSCGAGVMTRRRACVAGRCACGEREEQRRACRRAPCRSSSEPDAEQV